MTGDVFVLKEIDLTRKLTESYDMQEKLVADNADLEVKRLEFSLYYLHDSSILCNRYGK